MKLLTLCLAFAAVGSLGVVVGAHAVMSSAVNEIEDESLALGAAMESAKENGHYFRNCTDALEEAATDNGILERKLLKCQGIK